MNLTINKENTIGLVIDIQEKLLPHMQNHESVLVKCSTLVKGLSVLSVPVLVTQQYTKGLGNTLSAVAESIPNFAFIEKLSFSCYREPEFKTRLEQSGKQNVVICGIESHVCVLQTAIDLKNNGFNPIIVTDCISSRNENDKKVVLWRFRDIGCAMTTLESILFELTEMAGTPQFKEISKLIK